MTTKKTSIKLLKHFTDIPVHRGCNKLVLPQINHYDSSYTTWTIIIPLDRGEVLQIPVLPAMIPSDLAEAGEQSMKTLTIL